MDRAPATLGGIRPALRWVTLAALLLGLRGVAASEPYRHRGPPAQDLLTFWGWSASGEAFAYETYTPAEREDVDCSEEAVLRVIDTTRDRQVAVLRVGSGAANQEDLCQVPDVRAELATRRAAFLTLHHIIDGPSRPTGFDRSATGSEATQDGDWTTVLPGGREITARFEEKAGPDETWAAYRLVFPLGPRREVAATTKRIPGALGFDMEQAMMFYDKARRHAALFVPQVNAARYGRWETWDSHGLTLSR